MTPRGVKPLSRLLPVLTGWILTALFAGTAAAATAVVSTPALNLRAAPDTRARVLTTLERGSRVDVIADQGRWLKVRWRKTTGYLYNHPGYVRRETAAANRAGSLRRQSRNIDRKIRKKQRAVSEIKTREGTVLSDLDRMDRKINRLRKQSRSVHAQLKKLGRTIDRENSRLKELNRRIAAEESYAASRLTALYKLERLGKIELLASASSFYAFQLRRRALREILRRDQEVIARLAANRVRQQELIAAQRHHLVEKKLLEKTYRQRLADLSRQQGLRRQRLAEIRSRKSLELAALEELRQSAAQLDRKLRALQRRPPAAAAAYQPAPAPSPALRNRPHKSLPNIPVKGKIINRFGPYRDPSLHFESHRNGIDIRAERGAPIRSVDAGIVLFSQWFRGFGNVIIIDHGNHFYSVYAHIDEFFKQAGDRVARGEVIATVGDTGSLQGPILYFEIRRKGKPVNPRKWVTTG